MRGMAYHRCARQPPTSSLSCDLDTSQPRWMLCLSNVGQPVRPGEPYAETFLFFPVSFCPWCGERLQQSRTASSTSGYTIDR